MASPSGRRPGPPPRRRRNAYAALEHAAGLRHEATDPLLLLERMADLEVLDTKSFRARRPGPLDAASLKRVGDVFGPGIGSELSPAAMRLSSELAILWKWGTGTNPAFAYPGPITSKIVDGPRPEEARRMGLDELHEWRKRAILLGRVRLLAEYDRDRKIEMYRRLPRGSDGRIVWNVLRPFAKHPYPAPLRDAPRDVQWELPSWSPDDRAEHKRIRDFLLPYRDAVQALFTVIGGLDLFNKEENGLFKVTNPHDLMTLILNRELILDKEQRSEAERAAFEAERAAFHRFGSSYAKFMELFDTLVREDYDRLRRLQELIHPMWFDIDESSPIDLTKKALVDRPPQHLPVFSEIAVDLVFTIAKVRRPRRQRRPRNVAGMMSCPRCPLVAGADRETLLAHLTDDSRTSPPGHSMDPTQAEREIREPIPERYRRRGILHDDVLDLARDFVRLGYSGAVEISRDELAAKVWERIRKQARS